MEKIKSYYRWNMDPFSRREPDIRKVSRAREESTRQKRLRNCKGSFAKIRLANAHSTYCESWNGTRHQGEEACRIHSGVSFSFLPRPGSCSLAFAPAKSLVCNSH